MMSTGSFRDVFLAAPPPNFKPRLVAKLVGSFEDGELSPDAAEMVRQMHILEIPEVLASCLTDVLIDAMRAEFDDKCKGELQENMLSDMLEWFNGHIVSWLRACLCVNDQESTQLFDATLEKVRTAFYDCFARLRISELFNIIVEWPDSKTSLEDLRECLQHVQLLPHLVSSLRAAFEKRLLHAGASTSDIITQYISTIKAMRVVDPVGMILEAVSEPIRDYLRARSDTIRCIVVSLTDDSGSSDLFDELTSGAADGPSGTMDGYDTDDDDGGKVNLSWTPEPVDHLLGTKSGRTWRSTDIIGLLIHIFGSKDMFVNEYRSMLADRMLNNTSYDCERDMRTLEMLKLKFGDALLHNCSVMLRDVTDSKRINAFIDKKREEASGGAPDRASIDSLVISRLFWPTLRSEKFAVPPAMQEYLSEYEKQFVAQKAARTLEWHSSLGLVKVELELADRKVNVSVSPAHAALILLFQDKPTMTLHELSQALKLPPDSVKRKAALWVSQSVLKEDRSGADVSYTVIENLDGETVNTHVVEEDDGVASATQERDEIWETCQMFVVMMLGNLGPLPLTRIHNSLKMFVTTPVQYDRSEADLQQFLARLVRSDVIELQGGEYKVVKR